MAWGKKGELDVMAYATALADAKVLKEENTRLHAQIDRLQEALVAATAAKAYDSMQAAKYNLETTLSPETLAKMKNQQDEGEFWSKYIDEQEKPLFTDAEEMVMSLGRNIDINVGDDPIHPGNSES